MDNAWIRYAVHRSPEGLLMEKNALFYARDVVGYMHAFTWSTLVSDTAYKGYRGMINAKAII